LKVGVGIALLKILKQSLFFLNSEPIVSCVIDEMNNDAYILILEDV
jgi:hypothetical protein